MIDPVIFSIGSFSLRWYGVIVMISVIVGALITANEIKRRGENGDLLWDALLWVVPAGIIGARLWYVANATVDGSRYYVENPMQIINIPQGGLHIFGGFLLGGIALLIFLGRNRLDPWLFLDAAGPGMLIGQANGRIANFINQELYGPPTTLPWGIKIELAHRLEQFKNLPEATRFHPTFAYELTWNVAAASLLLWLSRRYDKDLKPGALFAGWLILAGVGRTWIEFFRPDQPKIDGLGISYSMVFASLMAITGILLLLVRYKIFNFSIAEDWEEEYHISGQTEPVEKIVEAEVLDGEVPDVKKTAGKAKKAASDKSVKKSTVRKKPTTATAKKTLSKPATKSKKSS